MPVTHSISTSGLTTTITLDTSGVAGKARVLCTSPSYRDPSNRQLANLLRVAPGAAVSFQEFNRGDVPIPIAYGTYVISPDPATATIDVPNHKLVLALQRYVVQSANFLGIGTGKFAKFASATQSYLQAFFRLNLLGMTNLTGGGIPWALVDAPASPPSWLTASPAFTTRGGTGPSGSRCTTLGTTTRTWVITNGLANTGLFSAAGMRTAQRGGGEVPTYLAPGANDLVLFCEMYSRPSPSAVPSIAVDVTWYDAVGNTLSSTSLGSYAMTLLTTGGGLDWYGIAAGLPSIAALTPPATARTFAVVLSGGPVGTVSVFVYSRLYWNEGSPRFTPPGPYAYQCVEDSTWYPGQQVEP